MKVISLLYHDIVSPGDTDSSGMSGEGAARYKLDLPEFQEHLARIKQVVEGVPGGVFGILQGSASPATFLLTFDDGGVSSMLAADMLENLGWSAHFFVTTDFIGKRGFLNIGQIRQLRRRGHIIGSHSCSHPPRLSACPWERILREWTDSRSALSDILGEEVLTGSVPGGFYSRRVARAAAAAGMRALFTSEPTTGTILVDGCMVLGRYTLRRGDSARLAASLAAGNQLPRLSQLAAWNFRKIVKAIGPQAYEKIKLLFLSRQYKHRT